MNNNNDNKSYSLKVPKVLSEKAKPIWQREGFRSFSEFVSDAARRRLEHLGY